MFLFVYTHIGNTLTTFLSITHTHIYMYIAIHKHQERRDRVHD